MPNLYNALLDRRDEVVGAGRVVIGMPYDLFVKMGVTIVVVMAGISLFCAFILLCLLGASVYKRRFSPSGHFFVRTHAAAYFSCLLIADLLQSVATIMSVRWINADGISLNMFCSVQGAIKNTGNLAISLWSLMLAVHTFCVLFLRWKPKDWVLYTTLIGVWLFIGFLVVLGPAAFQKSSKGPYFGISGYWCWISDPYTEERIMFEYFWMFASALISFILYTLSFLRLRGNIQVRDGKMRFQRIDSNVVYKYQIGRDSTDIQMTAVAKGMIAFPFMFTVIVLPIAICRFITWTGGSVPVEATIFADAIFSLAGVFDLMLFISTRPLLPAKGIVPFWFSPRQELPEEVREHGVQPYNIQDFASAHGFNDMYQSQAERNMVTLPPRTTASLTRPESVRPKRPLSLSNVTSDLNGQPHNGGGGGGRSDNRTTYVSRYSQDDTHLDHVEPPTAYGWDEVDLGRQPTHSRRSRDLGDATTNTRGASNRDTQYTTFSLSAYGYDRDSPEGRPPIPSTGIDLHAGRNRGYDDDERLLICDRNHDRTSYTSSASSGYDGPGIRQPEPAARRF